MERRRPTLQRLLSGAAALGLAFLLLAPGATAAPACTDLEAKQSKTPSTTAPGRRLRFRYTVKNNGPTRDLAFGIIVPPGVMVQKSGFTTHQSKTAPGGNATFIDSRLKRVFGVYFPTSTLLAKKSRKFSTTFTVAKCATMPSYLLFQARAMEILNNTIVCDKDFAQQKVTVQVPRKYKPQTNTTKLGKPCPLSFQLTDIGYKCAEAQDATSFIGSNPTFAECYSYCFYYGGVNPPYYFNYALSPAGSTCGCVGATCTLVPAPGSFVLQTLMGAQGGVPPPPPPPPEPPGPYPPVFEETVEEMNSNPLIPPAGVWNDGYDATTLNTVQQIMPITDAAAITAATGIATIPPALTNGPYTSAFLQQTSSGSAKAYSGIYYYPPEAAFNNLLFKDFVLNGMEGSYSIFLLAGAVSAPSYKIYTFSPSTLQTSIFVFQPANNSPTPVNGQWLTYTFNELTGDDGNWPTNTPGTGTSGWWCSQDCLLGSSTTYQTKQGTLRDLKTFVEGLLAQPAGSAGYRAINDAVITGFQLTIGSGENGVTAYTADFRVSTPRPNPIYSWAWDFGG